MIKLGSKVKDNITGLTGIVTARTEYLYGCVRCHIEPQAFKDGKPLEGTFLDEQRLEVIEETQPQVSKSASAGTGGPQADPTPRFDPTH